ncbi:probable beta-1,3-galactosyltransferase 14 [Cicer arietinum]|uniref:Hexosyltransferase n=1 Tax=Cicer arietinum TaxID=3827 RepID=A0A1S2XJ84_CICAR|nr:probable beta-1,3-galactosyltransferase 14 [Cicer arietinum]XP_004489038.1 probable beta-1,3-galactosyltransferase 14 [Cicer arietinum]XP_004489039.1 probable beta-1,3-galactosyltransferase 14 [Cicer arietinum]XP_004489040.1 probable beta-1,3-galactosyltransferase 14 [Cicer arietinum]
MPPSSFYARPTISYRRSSFLLLISFLLLLFFGITAFLRPLRNDRCLNINPRSVRVHWDHTATARQNVVAEDRHKVMAFVGIQTGFGSVGRRKSLRSTWFPSHPNGLQRLEEATGMAFRFVIGRTSDRWKMSALKREIAEYDDFIQLDIEEEYSKLPYKTLAFFKAAYALFEAEFYVKADDDIYLRPDRLSLLLAKERSHPQTYIGCMKKGPVFTDPKIKWYEPLSKLLGKEYFLHAYGPIYALSADVVSSLVALRNNSFRMFSNEDVTIGAWMLAMNVNHENNHNLCATECTPTSIAVWDIPKCSGLCNPEKRMLELHQMDNCIQSPTMESDE